MTAPLVPSRSRARVPTGIVHLGLGAFFRAHAAPMLQAVMDRDGGAWGVMGVSLRSAAVRDQLAAQDFVYTTVAMAEQGMQEPIRIECLNGVLVAPEDPAAVVDALADEGVRLVTLTVTEKGYHRGEDGAPLNGAHPDIQHDLSHDQPRTAPGFLVRALARRRAAGIPPFTVASLDNLPSNGRVIRAAVLAMAEQIDPALATWIAREGCFPCSMVDRIIPAATPAMIEQVAAATGVHDGAVVAHEPFCQWVLEDTFVDGDRPALERVGVQLVADVEPFERMKLRMLNGTHSALAYGGSLAGHETVAQAISDPVIAAQIDALWQDELAPSLTAPPDTDLAAYAQTLKARYQNPNIRHLLAQIAMDGSQKLPPRILDPLFENRQVGRAHTGLIAVVAAWMAFVAARVRRGEPLGDPLEPALVDAVRQAGDDPAALVSRLLDLSTIFAGYPVAEIAPALVEHVAAQTHETGGQ